MKYHSFSLVKDNVVFMQIVIQSQSWIKISQEINPLWDNLDYIVLGPTIYLLLFFDFRKKTVKQFWKENEPEAKKNYTWKYCHFGFFLFSPKN